MSLMQRRMMMAMGMENDEVKVYSGTFVGDGTADVYLDVKEEPDMITGMRADIDNLSDGLSRGIAGFHITKDMYSAISVISIDGATSISNGGHNKPSGLYHSISFYAEMIDGKLHIHASPISRNFGNGVKYDYVCVKYNQ